MIEIRWRYDPNAEDVRHQPATADEALLMLHMGNLAFANLERGGEHIIPVSAAELGLGARSGEPAPQTPIAVVLGCSDARVPLELIFSQSANDLFVVRLAGNILGSSCVGSVDFAIVRVPSVRLVAVVGHTGCGAVTAAVDAYLDPASYLSLSANLPLRRIVDTIMAAVRGADASLHAVFGEEVRHRPGYRESLIDTAVVLHAAVTADAVRRMFSAHLGEDLAVVFGVYDLVSRRVGLPGDYTQEGAWHAGLSTPPEAAVVTDFVSRIVSSEYIARLLDAS